MGYRAGSTCSFANIPHAEAIVSSQSELRPFAKICKTNSPLQCVPTFASRTPPRTPLQPLQRSGCFATPLQTLRKSDCFVTSWDTTPERRAFQEKREDESTSPYDGRQKALGSTRDEQEPGVLDLGPLRATSSLGKSRSEVSISSATTKTSLEDQSFSIPGRSRSQLLPALDRPKRRLSIGQRLVGARDRMLHFLHGSHSAKENREHESKLAIDHACDNLASRDSCDFDSEQPSVETGVRSSDSNDQACLDNHVSMPSRKHMRKTIMALLRDPKLPDAIQELFEEDDPNLPGVGRIQERKLNSLFSSLGICLPATIYQAIRANEGHSWSFPGFLAILKRELRVLAIESSDDSPLSFSQFFQLARDSNGTLAC